MLLKLVDAGCRTEISETQHIGKKWGYVLLVLLFWRLTDATRVITARCCADGLKDACKVLHVSCREKQAKLHQTHILLQSLEALKSLLPALPTFDERANLSYRCACLLEKPALVSASMCDL